MCLSMYACESVSMYVCEYVCLESVSTYGVSMYIRVSE